MNTVNSMEVHKAVKQKELGITLFGPTFGAKGSIKKVQGRHEAVRLLVQVSMIQMVGKYLGLPYWRVLGEDALPDEVVLSQLSSDFHRMNDSQKIAKTQEFLFLHGYDVLPTGVLDDDTRKALHEFDPTYDIEGKEISKGTFVNLLLSVPIMEATLGRRQILAGLDSNEKAVMANGTVRSTPEVKAGDQQVQETEPPVRPKKKGAAGRMLSDEEW